MPRGNGRLPRIDKEIGIIKNKKPRERLFYFIRENRDFQLLTTIQNKHY